MAVVLVLLLGLLTACLGLTFLLRARLTLGAQGRPWINRFVLGFWYHEAVDLHPISARLLGALLLATGGGAAILALRELL